MVKASSLSRRRFHIINEERTCNRAAIARRSNGAIKIETKIGKVWFNDHCPKFDEGRRCCSAAESIRVSFTLQRENNSQ